MVTKQKSVVIYSLKGQPAVDSQVGGIRAMVANMAQRAAILCGTLTGCILAHVTVPPIADVDVREVPGTLFLVGQLLLIILDVLLVVVAGQRVLLLLGEGGLRPGAEEGLPRVLQVATGQEGFAIPPFGRIFG